MASPFGIATFERIASRMGGAAVRPHGTDQGEPGLVESVTGNYQCRASALLLRADRSRIRNPDDIAIMGCLLEALSITVDEVAEVLASGEEVAAYPEDTPYPSRIILGRRPGGPLHVVVAYNPSQHETIVITVYEPDPAIWDSSFKRRHS